MKISDVTPEVVKEYLRVSDEDNEGIITLIIPAAKSYIKGYTGLSDTEIDSHEDITIALLCLCSDMFDNRQIAVQNDKVNPTVAQILAMYSTNLL